MITKLLYFVSHPIQYQAPLLRQLSADPDINLEVIFEDDFSEARYFDKGFGVDVEWDVPLCEGYKSDLLRNIDPIKKMKQADAVWFHGWQSRQFRKLLKLARRVGTPVLMRGENWEGAMPDGPGIMGWLKRLYLSQIFVNCEAYLAIGSANSAYYLKRGIKKDKIFEMPYAVDNAFFQAHATQDLAEKFRAELSISNNQKIILFAGKFSPRKKPDVLLKAWEQVAWRADARPALVFVGDGDLKHSLLADAERSEFKDDIYFTGFQNQTKLPGIYKAADVFVLASIREPWGLGINEAMACGTAVIASDQCGAAFDLITDETGAFVAAGNATALAAALVRVIEHSDEMGEAARLQVANLSFSVDIAGLKSALDYIKEARK